MENVIKSIKEIPYCGSIVIEGYRDLSTGEIKDYSGTNNPLNDFENPEYFVARWKGVMDKRSETTNCFYEEI